MAGYNGFSMSNNMIAAKASGLMTKTEACAKFGLDLAKFGQAERVGDITADEWHHTGCKYNRTNVYSESTLLAAFDLVSKKKPTAEQLGARYTARRADVLHRRNSCKGRFARFRAEWPAKVAKMLDKPEWFISRGCPSGWFTYGVRHESREAAIAAILAFAQSNPAYRPYISFVGVK